MLLLRSTKMDEISWQSVEFGTILDIEGAFLRE